MRKITVNLLSLLIGAAFVLGGCNSLQKMADKANLVSHKTTPNPLEMHAEKVPISISVTFPPKYFDKKAYLVITPVLKSDDKTAEKQFRSKTLQGESVKDNNPVIRFNEGGSYTYQDTIPYEDIYRMSDLELAIKATKGGESVNVMSLKVAEGIITTPRLVTNGMLVDNGSLGGSKTGIGRLIDQTVSLPASSTAQEQLVVFYPLQQDKLQTKEQRKAEVQAFIDKVKGAVADTEKEVSAITIASYASPDGPVDLNQNLVDGRGKNAQGFVTDELKKSKVDKAKDANFFLRETTASEDWDGFKKVTESSTIRDKELILRVLSMYSDPVVREKEIKNIAAAYTDLKTSVLPLLRRAEIKVSYKAKPRTKEDIVGMGQSNPDALDQTELFFACQECQKPELKVKAYTTYTSKYPNDWKGHNNLGNAYIRNNQLAEAEASLLKAQSMESNNSGILNNLGVLYYVKGDYKKSEEYFNKAKAIGNNDAIGYNLGVIMIKQARYSDAVKSFGTPNSFNKSLAQLLAGNTSAAQTTIDGVKSDQGIYFYLKAIVAARDNKVDKVIENLRTAIAKDESLKAYAKMDMEFFKFFENEAFKSLIN